MLAMFNVLSLPKFAFKRRRAAGNRQLEVPILTSSRIFMNIDINQLPRKLWQSNSLMHTMLVLEVCFVGCELSFGALLPV
jgi:hypothetical protein